MIDNLARNVIFFRVLFTITEFGEINYFQWKSNAFLGKKYQKLMKKVPFYARCFIYPRNREFARDSEKYIPLQIQLYFLRSYTNRKLKLLKMRVGIFVLQNFPFLLLLPGLYNVHVDHVINKIY